MTKSEAKAARHLREANNAFKAVGAEKPMTDYAKDQQFLHDNHERLKAARLAREAKSNGSRVNIALTTVRAAF